VNAAPAAINFPAKDEAPSHEDVFGSVYVNPAGHPLFISARPTEFPEGSVIVREKISGKDSQAPELLTVMVKRAKGFNPGGNDWEYMVLNSAGTSVRSRGKLDSCHACHSRQRETDFTFRTYLPKQ
jgi:hypothetical protein